MTNALRAHSPERGYPRSSIYTGTARKKRRKKRIRWRRRGRTKRRYYTLSRLSASTKRAGRYLLGRITDRGKRQKGRTGTWLVVNAKRWKKKVANSFHMPWRKNHLFWPPSRLLRFSTSSSFYLVFFLAIRTVLDDNPPAASTRPMRQITTPQTAHADRQENCFTDSTFEEFQELEYDAVAKRSGSQRAKWRTDVYGPVE